MVFAALLNNSIGVLQTLWIISEVFNSLFSFFSTDGAVAAAISGQKLNCFHIDRYTTSSF